MKTCYKGDISVSVKIAANFPKNGVPLMCIKLAEKNINIMNIIPKSYSLTFFVAQQPQNLFLKINKNK